MTSQTSTSVKLAPKDYKTDAEFAKALHGSNTSVAGYKALLNKNKEAQASAVDGYFKHWDNKDAKTQTSLDQTSRLDDYANLTKHYYNLCTDFYEYGWGSSFHFSRYYRGENFKQAAARHEHYLAFKLGLQSGMKVLDVGCGVGGPAREISRFTEANIVGLNNNDYQVEKANIYAKKENLGDKVAVIKGDFMQMDFEDESFDAVYAIEATVHAPVLEDVYREIRVGAVWPSWLRERQDPRGQGFESPPEQSFAKMQTLVLAEPRDYTAESVLAPTQGSLRKS